MKTVRAVRLFALRLVLLALAPLGCLVSTAAAQNLEGAGPIFKVDAPNQRLEMIVNTSRILTLDEKVPRAQVNNPDVVQLTPLSATQVQVHAKRAGVTQINLWNERSEIHTIDVVVFGDARELKLVLQSQFPRSTLTVTPLAQSVIIGGHVERPEEVSRVIQIAEDYHPKIINNISVGGAQQVLLDVKVMEISRSRLRTLGVDFSHVNGSNVLVTSVSGLISAATGSNVSVNPNTTMQFSVVSGARTLDGVIEALRQNNMIKVLADPKIVTVSGRPARFQAGGEFPVPVAGPLGVQGVEFRPFGTEVDFVPIVLGNGLIRLEVRPSVSEPNTALGTTISGVTVPARTLRQVDTGVEMRAGQTLAIAGLVQMRTTAEVKGLPWISELPYIGVPFRRVTENQEEIETLILVTPQLVEAMDPHEVPRCGPGMRTDSPLDTELYLKGYIEVPRCCPPGQAGSFGPYGGAMMQAPMGMPPAAMGPAGSPSGANSPMPPAGALPSPGDPGAANPPLPGAPADGPGLPPPPEQPMASAGGNRGADVRPAGQPAPNASPKGRYDSLNPPEPQLRDRSARVAPRPGFIGPTGYDVVN